MLSNPEEEIFSVSLMEQNFGGKSNLSKSKNAISASARMFLANVDSKFAAVKIYIEAGDKKNIALFTHQLKGTFLTLGSKILASVFKELEDGVDQLDRRQMEDKFNFAHDRLQLYKVKLGDFIETGM